MIELVAKHFNLSPDELRGVSRKKEFSTARQIAMYLSRETLGCGLAEIAQNFDRDHSTVLHAVRKIDNELQKNESLVRRWVYSLIKK